VSGVTKAVRSWERFWETVWESGRVGKVVLIVLFVFEMVPVVVGLIFIWFAWFDYLPTATTVVERITVLALIAGFTNAVSLWFVAFFGQVAAIIFVSARKKGAD